MTGSPVPGTSFGPVELGNLLLNFGGPYSSVSRTLRQPYSDEFDIGAEFFVSRRTVLSIAMFRRDDRDRLAAVNTGVSAQSFSPVSVVDPGPDGMDGTFDDKQLTVYAQNPATLGQDHYLLTNPAGLRMRNAGLQAKVGTQWHRLTLHVSFVGEKTYGDTNPGDNVYENDSGVIGSLFSNPNTLINAASQMYFGRSFVGKVQASYPLPKFMGGVEITTVADYTDGLVFARQLLVTGLPQGPFLVAATPRGSLEEGSRASYLINWNLRLSRGLGLPIGRATVMLDVLNVNNASQELQDGDLSGPSFNLRLPLAIQPTRFARLGFRYDF